MWGDLQLSKFLLPVQREAPWSVLIVTTKSSGTELDEIRQAWQSMGYTPQLIHKCSQPWNSEVAGEPIYIYGALWLTKGFKQPHGQRMVFVINMVVIISMVIIIVMIICCHALSAARAQRVVRATELLDAVDRNYKANAPLRGGSEQKGDATVRRLVGKDQRPGAPEADLEPRRLRQWQLYKMNKPLCWVEMTTRRHQRRIWVLCHGRRHGRHTQAAH